MKCYLLFILLSLSTCSFGQNQIAQSQVDYSKEILGCWENIDIIAEVESNYEMFDTLTFKVLDDWISKLKAKTVYKFHTDNNGKAYTKDKSYFDYPISYILDNDRFLYKELVRNSPTVEFNIKILNDTLYLTDHDISKYQLLLKWTDWEFNIADDIPKNLVCKKFIITYVYKKCETCDFYED
ncbi:hypothetical protein [Bacteroides sp. 519]|uniref:hypothetical protein n=1 Tax=Bacteroides sp. 519 TaxID=2302937 RepID=UPI0013D0B5A3|nr:hypothetical protein [Bacteroides sp. 519]NDV59309.1 hypothetical protein [Bacteroides sp. 519]